MNNTENNGWGAFQNLKKENQNLKKEIIAKNENNYGERIIVDKYNNFRNINSRVNPFRFPDSIKNEVIEKEYTPTFKKEEENEYEICEKLIIKNQNLIDELTKLNFQYKNELENKIKLLEKDYNFKILDNSNKIQKIQKKINNLQKIIDINDESDNSNNTNNSDNDEKKLPTPKNIAEQQIILNNTFLEEKKDIEETKNTEDKKHNKLNKNRPETIKGCFNTNTIIRHKKSGFEEFCIYIVSEGSLFRCDKSGKYDKNSIMYSKLNQFTSDNYKKNTPNRTHLNNAYNETEYLCKISNEFLPLTDLTKGTIYN